MRGEGATDPHWYLQPLWKGILLAPFEELVGTLQEGEGCVRDFKQAIPDFVKYAVISPGWLHKRVRLRTTSVLISHVHMWV